MDSRTTPLNPFARPLSEQGVRDPRNVPIPPPPYTLQAPVRPSQPTFTNDPFMPRRVERDDSRQEPAKSLAQGTFSVGSYAASFPRDALGTATVFADGKRVLRDNSGSWRLGEQRLDRFRPQDTDVSSSSSSSTPLPPPPPTSALPPSLQDPAFHRDAARPQDLRTSSPRMYGTAQEHPPPPPPPPFSGRPMLPPSPQYNAPASMSRVPPPPPPFSSGGRDLPAPSSVTRPGSSMSISSMLDSAPGRPSREHGASTNMNGTSPTGSYSSSSQNQPPPDPSPTRSSNGNGILRRSSPEKHYISQAPINRPFRAYSGGAQQRSYTTIKASSPESSTFGPLSATPTSQYSPRSDIGIQQDWKFQHNRTSSMGRIIDRPSSQPNGYNNTSLDLESRKAEMMEAQLLQTERSKQEENALREASLRQANKDRVASFEYLPGQAQLERLARLEQEKNTANQSSPREDRLSGMNYPFLTQSSVFSEPSISAPRPEKESVEDRVLQRSLSTQSNIPKGPLPEESLRRLREERQRLTQQTMKFSPTASRHPYLDSVDERQTQTYPQNATPGTGNQEGRASVDSVSQQLRSMDESNQSHRSMLALINDNNKRAGRISPLPQAVQGAQGQKRGPSSDPSIKNEFSRMFAGIGSGVGSAGLNSGASTPFPPSPKQNPEADQRIPFSGRNDILDFAKSRNGSRVGRRPKKAKEDRSKDVEIIEDRTITVPSGTRGIKKSRHYHHINHRHQHHRLDDQNGTPSRNAGNSTTPLPNQHSNHHHHHHPDGTIHYHPHSKPHKAPRIPSITINNEPILEMVRDVPRRHLGATLYLPSLELPISLTSYDPKLTDTPPPYTIPRCDGKENCTLTVRIPRFYLSKEELEKVCLGRAVWGTDIYTDDSDPLAAAIHGGWIRGEWGHGIDFSMLEAKPGKDAETNQTVFTSVPASPVLPPADKDLHLTLLILPTLQKYTSRVAHGIRSRAWGSDHDGMSYRIEKMAWADEGAGRGEERDAESRRKRLKMMTGLRVAAPTRRLGGGRPLDKAQVATAAAA